MTHWTRRNLLKTGLVASAGLLSTDHALSPPSAEAEMIIDPEHSELSIAATGLSTQVSPRERLLLDFGWRFHLGNADDYMRDFRWGAPQREGTFAKAGQNWIHNPTDGSLQHSFDDSAWRVLDLPHDWAVELPFAALPAPDVAHS